MTVGYVAVEEEAGTGIRLILQAYAGDATARRVHHLSAESLHGLDLLWVHASDKAAYQALRPLLPLRPFVERGGGLLLTGFAALLPYDLGLESRRPSVQSVHLKEEGYGRKRGFQSFRGHPLFRGLHGGAYIWDAHEDHTAPHIGFFGTWPLQGRVVAVERGYVRQFPEERTVVFYTPGAGRLLAVGGHVYPGRPNHQQHTLHRFLHNALDLLAGHPAETRATFWLPKTGPPAPFVLVPRTPLARRPSAGKPLEDLLLLTREPASPTPFDLAGTRCLLMGREKSGVDEVWVHPFRLLRDLQAGLVTHEGVTWLASFPARFERRTASVTRIYALPNGHLTETLCVDKTSPGGMIRFRYEGDQAPALVLRFRSDLRWMWPYHENALGSLSYAFDGALHLTDPSRDFYALAGADTAPLDARTGAFETIELVDGRLHGTPSSEQQVCHAARYALPSSGAPLTFAFAGTNLGREEAEATFLALLQAPEAVQAEAEAHVRRLLDTSTLLTAPDPVFNEGYRWAVVETDRFRATTPGLGTALVAGYATTATGWDGGHRISGRPGYAWYFGRDAAWAAFAVLGYGDFDTVRQQLALFERFQDGDGKVFHELTTSGVAHYDAADATPLYLILAAAYLRASGDLAFLQNLWPSLQRALDFCYRTDTDGDGLIENTDVGHGWIEGGALFGAHVTLYLAGLWARTLTDTAYLADHLDAPDLARRCRLDAERVRSTIEADFWNPEMGFYHYGLKRDGTYTEEPTILPAVLMHFGVLDPARTETMLEAFAGQGFTSDWGVRILSTASPLFNPQGYHYGSVWPLFTGWAALAEYAYGRSVAAFTHMRQNLDRYRDGALGVIPEVMHGTRFEDTGVCPHQCWSQTNALHPISAGLLGFSPDAPAHAVRLSPRPPIHWDHLHVQNIRVGETRFDLRFESANGTTRYHLQRTSGPSLTITLAPEVPEGRRILGMRLEDRDGPAGRRGADGLLSPPVSFYLQTSATLVLTHRGGVGVVPVIPTPVPGAPSTGMRILHGRLKEDRYTITVEAAPGSRHTFRVRLFDTEVARVEGALASPVTPDGYLDLSVIFGAEDTQVVRLFLRR